MRARLGAAQQIWDVLAVRFNMNGKKPAGRKVGMLDELHLWCLMMDPFAGDWRGVFIFDGNIRQLAKNMIAQFILDDEDGFVQLRVDLLEEFEVSDNAPTPSFSFLRD